MIRLASPLRTHFGFVPESYVTYVTSSITKSARYDLRPVSKHKLLIIFKNIRLGAVRPGSGAPIERRKKTASTAILPKIVPIPQSVAGKAGRVDTLRVDLRPQ
jgi:hypothetical protein